LALVLTAGRHISTPECVDVPRTSFRFSEELAPKMKKRRERRRVGALLRFKEVEVIVDYGFPKQNYSGLSFKTLDSSSTELLPSDPEFQ
jgi:hypothetical protein